MAIQFLNNSTKIKGQEKNVTPSTLKQIITPDEGYNALTSVTVNAVTASIDSNIKKENIKSGVSILGITGTLEDLDTSDANATANDIISGKTAYVDGTKITGTLTTNLSNSFNDSNADVLSKLQTAYDNMTPRVLTSGDYKNVCQNLKVIPVKYDGTPLLDTSGLTDMSRAFQWNNDLKILPLIDTSNVTNMKAMLFMCENLEHIALLNTSKVTNMLQMFYMCENLKKIPLIDTSEVTDMNSIVGNCTLLEDIPLLDISKVIVLTSAFHNCPNLSDESLNNILEMLTNATEYIKQGTNMNLEHIGLSQTQAQKCTTLSNWAACEAAGWATGY